MKVYLPVWHTHCTRAKFTGWCHADMATNLQK